MNTIRQLFEPNRNLDRRIEKVILFDSDDNEQLKREITEYVVTDSIEKSFQRLLDRFDAGMAGGKHEIGVWVSGFYGSGKSSFTKYLGFALDPTRTIDGKPFLGWLQDQLESGPLSAQLGALAKRYPATVIMLDLASAQIAGATMAEISTVLYWTVMQWAGYSKDKKIAYFQMMLERDGKREAFELRIAELSKGKTWKQIQNQPLVANQFAGQLAHEFYPEFFPDADSFQRLRVDEAEKENERVAEMLELIRRKAGKENIIFILDEVGQYIAARDNLILNLDGFAKNIRFLGSGKVWLIGTAQQTLTEDDPNARFNSAKLFKLADRFPIRVDLEATDIREICYRRLLAKSPAGDNELFALYDSNGAALKFHTQLSGTRYYKAGVDKDEFRRLYPFLPQHFDILLELLGRLAKISGGIGLRSAIKVIQDVLVDQSSLRPGQPLLADAPVGALATTVTLYDSLRFDIERSREFKHVVDGAHRAEKAFGLESHETKVAKTIAVLQVLEDFPTSSENVAALLHPAVDASSQLDAVKQAVGNLMEEEAVHLSEVNGRLQFMSEAVAEIESAKAGITPYERELRKVLNEKLAQIFTPGPTIRLEGTRSVAAGVKTAFGASTISLLGEREPIHFIIEFIETASYERRRDERIGDSGQPANRNAIFWIARQDPTLESLLTEIVRCREIYNQNRNKTVEKQVGDYLNGQLQRAERLTGELEQRLRSSLGAGSFIFRGVPVAVVSRHPDINGAAMAQLDEVAHKVFSKYSLAPIQAEGQLAERFLKTPNLAQIASQNDPLGLVVSSAGQKKINSDHHALVAIKDYLAKNGQVEGPKLLDDFFSPEFGWSKDTTRYLLSALLVAGLIKLRIAGADVTVRGESAIESLRNNNSFKKAGVALRHSTISPESKIRAAERLLDLTGEQVMPLEQDISEGVMKHFPSLLNTYAPLQTRLRSCNLPGSERAADLQDSLIDILKADASDATPRLGAEICPLFESLLWAHQVHQAFLNGIEAAAGSLRNHLSEIEKLPRTGACEKLILETAGARTNADDLLKRDDVFNQITGLQSALSEIEIAVRDGCKALAAEQSAALEHEIESIESTEGWVRLGAEHQDAFSKRCNDLRIKVPDNLEGIQRLISHQYLVSIDLPRIRNEIVQLAKEDTQQPRDRKPVGQVEIALPKEISSGEEADVLIAEIHRLKTKLREFERITISWI
jgi:hypothetical protein